MISYASDGWLIRFRKRANLMNLRIQGETVSTDRGCQETSRGDNQDYCGGRLPSQVFNLDETGHFWKEMPSQAYISREEKEVPGDKVSKDRLILLGCNAEGDVKLKHFLVYH